MEEVDLRKPYPDMTVEELLSEYNYLAGLYKDSDDLGMTTTKKTVYKHLRYVRALLEERNQIH